MEMTAIIIKGFQVLVTGAMVMTTLNLQSYVALAAVAPNTWDGVTSSGAQDHVYDAGGRKYTDEHRITRSLANHANA